MGNSDNSPIQKIYYFKVGEYLEAVRYIVSIYSNESGYKKEPVWS